MPGIKPGMPSSVSLVDAYASSVAQFALQYQRYARDLDCVDYGLPPQWNAENDRQVEPKQKPAESHLQYLRAT